MPGGADDSVAAVAWGLVKALGASGWAGRGVLALTLGILVSMAMWIRAAVATLVIPFCWLLGASATVVSCLGAGMTAAICLMAASCMRVRTLMGSVVTGGGRTECAAGSARQ